MTYQAFKKAIVINSVNVVAYKSILQVHQLFLFYVINKELFGIAGILFSIIYFLINVTNFGFDYSIFAFYKFFTQSKKHFIKLVHQVLIRFITLLIVAIILISYCISSKSISSVSLITNSLPIPILIVLFSIFISESMKKTLELFALLAFLNRAITIIDITMLLCYVSSMWIYFFIYQTLNLYIIFIPMAVTSWIEIAMIIKRLFVFYKTLPEHSSIHLPEPKAVIFYKNQMINYVNQLTKAFFSPNFMIIFISYFIGIIQTGYIKVIIDSIIVLYMLLNKAVGIPSAALMSHASSMQKSLSTEFKIIFLKICNTYIQFLYGLATIASIVITHCLVRFHYTQETLPSIIIFFTFISFLEYLVLLYEKLFLTHHKEYVLALINSLSLTTLLITLLSITSNTHSFILLPFAIIRFASVAGIITVSQQIWHLKPILYPQLKTVLISLLLSIPLLLSCF